MDEAHAFLMRELEQRATRGTTAYRMLLGQEGGRPRVSAGDPACSVLAKRLLSSDPAYRMPKGPTPLLPAEK